MDKTARNDEWCWLNFAVFFQEDSLFLFLFRDFYLKYVDFFRNELFQYEIYDAVVQKYINKYAIYIYIYGKYKMVNILSIKVVLYGSIKVYYMVVYVLIYMVSIWYVY